MNDLTPEQLDRLETAHDAFRRGDGVAKARLLAALAAEVPPRQCSPWTRRLKTVRREIPRVTAAAAAVVLALFFLSQGVRPNGVFAQTVKAMLNAKGFSCDLVGIDRETGKTSVRSRLFWASNGAGRLEYDQAPRMIEIRLPDQSGIQLRTESKEYRVLPRHNPPPFTFGLFGRLADHQAKSNTPKQVEILDGKPLDKFDVPFSTVTGDESPLRMRVWLDQSTKLPVRVDFLNENGTDRVFTRFENFVWGDQPGSLFDTTPPKYYKALPVVDVQADEITEYVTYAFKISAKYNDGKYPARKYIFGDEQREELRKRMGMGPDAPAHIKPSKDLRWDDPKKEEFAHATYGFSWINVLQREYPECVYNGKTVGSGDAAKVLLRWKLSDGSYRVIMGDLRSETTDLAGLRRLESR